MMTGTVARGGCRTSAGRVRGWGRGRAARGARARGLSEDAPDRPDARARKAACGRSRAVRARHIRRHFDVVKSVGVKKGPRARAARERRGGEPSARLRAETRAAAVAAAVRRATTGSRDAAPGARVPRAPPRPPAPRAGKGGKARVMAPAGRISGRGAYLLRSRRARREGARARFCVPESARSRFSPGPRACARARWCGARARDGVSFPLRRQKAPPGLRGPAFGNIAPRPAFRGRVRRGV